MRQVNKFNLITRQQKIKLKTYLRTHYQNSNSNKYKLCLEFPNFSYQGEVLKPAARFQYEKEIYIYYFK